MPRGERFGIGARIDACFLDMLDGLRLATYASQDRKAAVLESVLLRVDALRFFLQIAWESKLIAHAHYAGLAGLVEEVGRMTGGWKKGIMAKTSAP